MLVNVIKFMHWRYEFVDFSSTPKQKLCISRVIQVVVWLTMICDIFPARKYILRFIFFYFSHHSHPLIKNRQFFYSNCNPYRDSIQQLCSPLSVVVPGIPGQHGILSFVISVTAPIIPLDRSWQRGHLSVPTYFYSVLDTNAICMSAALGINRDMKFHGAIVVIEFGKLSISK